MPEVRPLSWAWALALGGVLLPALYLFKDLPLWSEVFFVGGLSYLLLKEGRGDFKPLALKAQLLILAPFLGLTFYTFTPETLVPDLLGFLLVLATLKLLGERAPRDILQLFLLGGLFLVGAAVWRLDLVYGLVFVLEVALTVTGLFFLYAGKEVPVLPQRTAFLLLALGGLATLGVLLLTVFYFLFLPRPQYTFWASSWGASRTGLSEKVAPGEVSALKEDPTVAFRVRWISGPRPKKPYFRVFVYQDYRRGVWQARSYKRPPSHTKGPWAWLEVLPQIEAVGLPVPGYALKVKTLKGPRAFLAPEGTVRLSSPGPGLWRIKVFLGPLPPETPPSQFLEVPVTLKEDLLPLAKRLEGGGPWETVARVLAYLRENYTYSLKPGAPRGEPVRWFLFESHRGHCEYFASAAVFLLRTLGLPARVVGGYAGGEWNPLGGYYLLREKDAHTWIEVFFPFQGWVPFDPTPLGGATLKRSAWWRSLWDYLQFKWSYWVITYDLGKQLRLVRGLSQKMRSFSYSKLALKGSLRIWLGLVLVLVLGAGAWRAWRWRKEPPWEKFLRYMARRGHPKSSSQTFKEYVEELACSFPEARSLFEELLSLYYREAYGGEDTRKDQKKWWSKFKAFARQRKF